MTGGVTLAPRNIQKSPFSASILFTLTAYEKRSTLVLMKIPIFNRKAEATVLPQYLLVIGRNKSYLSIP
jgi:hypothetical protein